jgi:hypothetical protein
MKGFDWKICASIVADAFCVLHNDKYAKYTPYKNFALGEFLLRNF